jgi:hypothetical protein
MTNENVQKQKWLSPVDEYQTKMNTIGKLIVILKIDSHIFHIFFS